MSEFWDLQSTETALRSALGGRVLDARVEHDELSLELVATDMAATASLVRDVGFDSLMDVCGVDYLHYGLEEWETTTATGDGFERGVRDLTQDAQIKWRKPRYAVVYHLLSTTYRARVRLMAFLDEHAPEIESVTSVWPAADWFEREAYDLFGIVFRGHQDLRRILTDYGFEGHPFRKDFPLSGHVELRYDAAKKECVYDPVSIEPRVLVPKVIRHDARYAGQTAEQSSPVVEDGKNV